MNSTGVQTHSTGANVHSAGAKMNSADAKTKLADVAMWLSTVESAFAGVQPPAESHFGQPEQLKPQKSEDPPDGVAGGGAVLENVEGVLSDGLIHQRYREIAF